MDCHPEKAEQLSFGLSTAQHVHVSASPFLWFNYSIIDDNEWIPYIHYADYYE